jgi:glycosyltransferase involved in cell wall biosynthesis
MIYKWVLRKAGHVFVQNKTDRESLLHTTGVLATAIPNGHRLAELRPSDFMRKQEGGLRDTVLWIGRSAEVKRPMLFIELAEKTPDEHFTMICQHATGDRNYDNLVERAEQVKNLRFIQRVPFDKVDSFFQCTKVFVNTSDAEGFPNTFIQACQFGVPILSLNVNPDGFLDEYGCGISCEGDFKRFRDSLGFMLAENRYIEMGKRGRKYVEQNHDIKKIIEEYKKIFRQLLGSTSSL